MSPQNLYAVAIRLMAIWFVSLGVITLLSMVTGPFATLIFGVILLVFARTRRPFDGNDVTEYFPL